MDMFILMISVLGPILGSFIGILRKPSKFVMLNMLSFSAGIMLSISFLQLIPQSIEMTSIWICLIGVIFGTFFMYLLDLAVPHIHPGLCKQEHGCNLEKTATFLIMGIFMHNFPEGMAIAAGSVTSLSSGMTIAIAIAIHNIPEGICTSAPFYYCNKKRLKAFLVSASTAFPIVVGYIFGKLLFGLVSSTVIGLIIAATAGLMIYISADELIPTACAKDNGHTHSTIFSLTLGVLLVIVLGAI